jgi:hypothetical protein
MATVQRITPDVLDIHVPSPIRDLPIFLCWRYEAQYEGDPKPLKTPYYPSGGKRYGKQGSGEDRAKLTTYALAKAQAIKRGMSGIGIALLEGYDIVAVDVDNCVVEGRLPQEVLDAIGMTYAEYSPSGRGVRALLRGNLGNHKAPTTLTEYGFEVFSTSGYVTLTGNMLGHVDLMDLDNKLAPVPPKLLELCERRFGTRRTDAGAQPLSEADRFFNDVTPGLGLSVERMQELLGALDPDMGRDEWIRVGMALHHECEGDDTGFELWDDWSAGGATYPGTEGLRTQWESFTRREGSGRPPITMASVIKMVKEAGSESPTRPTEAASADELSRVAAETAQSDAPYEGRFPVISAGELSRRKPTDWLIKGVLPRADLVVLYGASGSGKSFVGIDLMAAIARGVPWRERRVKKARAIIIAAEGGGGMGKRIEAYCQHHNVNADDLDIGVITAPPNFMEKGDITDLVRAITAAGGADVIMVDTFAQVTPGANENAAEDMGLALANARALRDATGAVVVLVHHAGKDTSKGSRGWSGIKAAADAEIEVIRHEDSPVREIRISKMKDGDDGLRWAFRLDVLEVGIDSDGDAITSCVAVEAEMPPPQVKATGGRKFGRVESHVMEMISEHIDPLAPDADMDEVIRFCVDGMPKPEPGTRDVRRQHVQRALHSLTKGNDAPIAIEHGKVVFLSAT